MACTCLHTNAKFSTLMTYERVKKYDPTRTTSLRNAFAKQMDRRFDALARAVQKKVVEDDVFGLSSPVTHGGEGSGNFGHAGIPGHQGGSAKTTEESIKFKQLNPSIKESSFDLTKVKDQIKNWDRINYEMNALDKIKVDSLLKLSTKEFEKLPPVIIERFTPEGGWKIIDGW